MKRLILLCLFAIFTIASSLALDNGSAESFSYNGNTLPYRIMRPTDSGKKYPLVIFLHGKDERGTDNTSQLKNGAGEFLNKFTNDYSAIVLAPQCPLTSFWTRTIKEDAKGNITFNFTKPEAAIPAPPLETLMKLINHLIATENVDASRVYVGGMSMGALGAYELLWRMPSKTFAAAFTICGGTDTTSAKLESYAKNTPVWIFHGDADPMVSVAFSRDAYSKLQQINGSLIKYTEYPKVGHNCWTNVFANQDLIPWLFGYTNIELGYYKIAPLTKNTVITKTNNALSLSVFSPSAKGQDWLLTKMTPYSYRIQTTDGTNTCLSVSGNNLTFAAPSTSKDQLWKLVQSEKGVYNIVSEANNYRLELSSNNGFVLTNNKTDDVSQKWKITHSKLYLVGGATPGVWNINSAQEMQFEDGTDATFTWSGFLSASDFKFQSTKLASWETTYNSISANKVPSLGEEQKLVTQPQSQYDYKFKLNEAGYYKLTVDMTTKSVRVTKATVDKLYLTGAAAPCGWNNLTALPMQRLSDSVYTWNGQMNAGEFKFITKLGTWNSIVPNRSVSETIITGYSHEISDNYRGDYKFIMPEAGSYTITVNLASNTMRVDKQPKNKPIYIVGSATPIGWNNNNPASAIEPDANGIYTWTGDLVAGELKFLTKLTTWNSLIAASPNMTIVPGATYGIYNTYNVDNKFLITTKGRYTITVDLKSKTIVINNSVLRSATGIPSINTASELFTAKPGKNSIEVTISNDVTVSKARLIGVRGNVVESVENKTGQFYLGNQIPAGIYIVEISCNGKAYSQKVLVK